MLRDGRVVGPLFGNMLWLSLEGLVAGLVIICVLCGLGKYVDINVIGSLTQNSPEQTPKPLSLGTVCGPDAISSRVVGRFKGQRLLFLFPLPRSHGAEPASR